MNPRRLRLLTLLLLVMLGAIPRLLWLAESPSGLWYDEALNGENALRILGRERPIFFYPDGYPQEPLFFYLQAGALQFASDGRPAILPLRLVSALVGILTLLAFWPFARRVLPPGWALLAVGVLAFFPWHLHFSRLGFRTILAPLFVCLVGWGLLEWLRRGRGWVAAFAGAALGLSLYSYTAVNALPLAAATALVLGLLWGRGTFAARSADETARRRSLVGIALGATAFLLVFAPLGIYYLGNGSKVLARVAQVGPGSGDFTILGNAGNILLFFSGIVPDPVFKHGPTARPAFPFLFAPIFFVGMAWLLLQARRRAGAGIYCWLAFLGFAAASLFSDSAPNRLRMLGCVPVVVVGFVAGLRLLHAGVGRLGLGQLGARFAVGILLGLMAWGEASAVIYEWHADPRIYQQFSGPFTQVAHWAHGGLLPAADGDGDIARRPEVPFLIPSAIAQHATVRYLTRDAFNTAPLEDLERAIIARPGQQPGVYLLLTQNAPQNEAVLRQLGVRYAPAARLENPISGEVWGVVILIERRTEPFGVKEAEIARGYLTDR